MPSTLGIVASSRQFSPLDLSPELWLDAADTSTITASSGLVSQWDDKSGNGLHVTQATGSAQPTTGTRTVNGLNAIDFVRLPDRLRRTNVNLAQPFTIFGVALADSIPGVANRYFDGFEGSTLGRALFYVLGGTWRLQAGVAVNTTLSRTLGTAKQQTAIFDGSSSKFYENGTQHGGTLNPGTGGIINVNISTDGTNIDNNGRWDGLVCELIIYGSVLSDDDREKVETHLAAKWGL